LSILLAATEGKWVNLAPNGEPGSLKGYHQPTALRFQPFVLLHGLDRSPCAFTTCD
jgi:hypothetical protein